MTYAAAALWAILAVMLISYVADDQTPQVAYELCHLALVTAYQSRLGLLNCTSHI